METKKTIILTGGGTAGHIMPNIALLPQLKKHFDRICYIGSNGMEKTIIKNYGIEFYEIEPVKLIRRFTLKNLLIPYKLIKSIYKSKKIIEEINPNVIFSKGGYVSMPVAIAGKKCNVPVISHESDLSMGLANKIIARYSKCVCTSFYETSLLNEKFIYTGSPIRKQIFKGDKDKVFKKYDFDLKKPTILFLGGSQGSKIINENILKCLNELTKKYNIIHISGNSMEECKMKNYARIKFTDKIEDLYSACDMVVCRSGANTIFEVLALNKPMLLIPLAKNESRGDQIENAEYFCKKGYAKVLFQEQLTKNTLLKQINNLYKYKDKIILKQKSVTEIDSNKKIVEVITKLSTSQI